jgi:hypothetical protein
MPHPVVGGMWNECASLRTVPSDGATVSAPNRTGIRNTARMKTEVGNLALSYCQFLAASLTHVAMNQSDISVNCTQILVYVDQ